METMSIESIPAESGQACACCGRTHRKLVKVMGRMVGKTCRTNIEIGRNCGIPCLAQYSQLSAERVACFLGVKMDAQGRHNYGF